MKDNSFGFNVRFYKRIVKGLSDVQSEYKMLLVTIIESKHIHSTSKYDSRLFKHTYDI